MNTSHDEGKASVDIASTEVALTDAPLQEKHQPLPEEEKVKESQPPSQSVINSLVQVGKGTGNWEGLTEAIRNNEIEVVPSDFIQQIQGRFEEYERHMEDYKLMLAVQRLVVNILYPAMKRPHLIKEYLNYEEGKASVNIAKITKALLGFEFKMDGINDLFKVGPKLLKLFKNQEALKSLYQESELKPILDQLHTTKHFETVDVPDLALDYAGICYRHKVITNDLFDAAKHLELLTEEQIEAIISTFTNENDEQ